MAESLTPKPQIQPHVGILANARDTEDPTTEGFQPRVCSCRAAAFFCYPGAAREGENITPVPPYPVTLGPPARKYKKVQEVGESRESRDKKSETTENQKIEEHEDVEDVQEMEEHCCDAVTAISTSEGSEGRETTDIFQPRANVKVEKRPRAERLHADRSDSWET